MIKLSNKTIFIIGFFLCFLSYYFGIVDLTTVTEHLKSMATGIITALLCIYILIKRIKTMSITLKILSSLIILAAVVMILASFKEIYFWSKS